MSIDKSSKTIQELFNKISSKYDFINNFISLNLHTKIKKDCIKKLNIKPNSKILDLCCGTGDLAKFIKEIQPNCQIIGVDFSSKMLEIAKNKTKDIEFINMDVQNMSFEDNSFDYVVSSFGLRNVEHIEKAIYEIHRVLKPNGLFLHLDFGNKNILSKFFNFFVLILSNILFKYKNEYIYLIKSKNNFYEPKELIKIFENNKLKFKKRKDYIFKTISSQIMEK